MNHYSDESPLLGDVSFNNTPTEDGFSEKPRRASLAEELGMSRNPMRLGRSSRRAKALLFVMVGGLILIFVRIGKLPGPSSLRRRSGSARELVAFDRMTVSVLSRCRC